MNRKQFMQSVGATCSNWNWSWSFVNKEKRFVIFGASNNHECENRQLILSKGWSKDLQGRKKSGYSQALKHLDLIINESYQLKTFRQTEKLWDEKTGKVTITDFEQELFDKQLHEKDGEWYGMPVDFNWNGQKGSASEKVYYLEGSKSRVSSWYIERSSAARKVCLEHYGYHCDICKFDFLKRYGEIGKEFTHVHHKEQISKKGGEYLVDPIDDLIPVCPNCHAMIHRGGKNRNVSIVKKAWDLNGK